MSFAHTTPALLAGRKTVTRRDWSDRYGPMFNEGDELQAWDASPFTRKGHRVATIRLTAKPYKEDSRLVHDDDWEGEGFGYMEEHGLTLFGGMTPRQVFEGWRSAPEGVALWVVRFELVEVAGD